MATLKEVYDLYKGVNASMALLGQNAELRENLKQQVSALVKTLIQELNISEEEAMELPLTTEIPPKTAAEFQAIKDSLPISHTLIGEFIKS